MFIDGASRGNPGKAGAGIAVKDEENKIIATHKKYLGTCTNNVAEYNAVIESISFLKNSNIEFDVINFYSDSELIVKQIKGLYKIRNKDLIELSIKFWNEIKSLNKKFSITHVPREENSHADKLANEAIDEMGSDRSLMIND